MIAGALEFLRRPIVVRVAQIALGIVFIIAAVAKIPDMATFAKQVEGYKLAPLAIRNVIAIVLPWVEVVAGLALIVGVRRRAGAVVALVSMAVFTIAVGWAWSRGLSIDCGCFGSGVPKPVGAEKMLQNVGLTALAVIAVLRPTPTA